MVRDMEIMLSGWGGGRTTKRSFRDVFLEKQNRMGIPRFWKPLQIFEVLSYGNVEQNFPTAKDTSEANVSFQNQRTHQLGFPITLN